MSNIRKGDKVVVISGSDKGKKGSVLKMFPKENRALVQGVNVVKRHQRQTQTPAGRDRDQGGRRSIFRISRITDPKTGAATRVGYKTLGDGRRVRFAKKSGEVIDV